MNENQKRFGTGKVLDIKKQAEMKRQQEAKNEQARKNWEVQTRVKVFMLADRIAFDTKAIPHEDSEFSFTEERRVVADKLFAFIDEPEHPNEKENRSQLIGVVVENFAVEDFDHVIKEYNELFQFVFRPNQGEEQEGQSS